MSSASLIGYKYARQPLSAPGQPSIAKSTLTAATYIPGRDKRLVFASEWVFKPEGIRAVKLKFRDALKKNDLIADHEWDDEDKVFRVRCIVGDTPRVSAIFSTILSDIIGEAHGDDYLSDEDEDVEIMVSNSDGEEVPFESDNIERISVWKKTYGITKPILPTNSMLPATELPPQDCDLVESAENVGLDELDFVWTCEDTNLSLDDIASDDILSILEDLTGCSFEKDLKQGKLFISHFSAENCHRAMRKLDNLKKYSEPKTHFVFHIFYAEDVGNFQLRLCPFIGMKRKFFKTTLLNPYRISPAMNYGKLGRAVTIRCAPWGGLKANYLPTPIRKLVPATKGHESILKVGGLVKLEYCGKGKPENHPLRHLVDDEECQDSNSELRPNTSGTELSRDLELVKKTRIEGWAQQIPGTFPNSNFGDVARQLVSSSSNIPRFQSRSASSKNQNQSCDSSSQDDLFQSKAPDLARVKKTHAARYILDEDVPGLTLTPLMPSRLSSASQSELVSSTKLSVIQEVSSATTTQTSSDNATVSSLPHKLSQETQTETSKRPTKEKHTTTNQKTSNPTQQDQKEEQRSRALELSISPSASRASQPKGDTRPFVQDPASGFATEANTSFRSLMKGLQGFPGEIIVQAEFGRIILRKIDPSFVTSDNNLESFPQKEILAQLLPNSGKAGNPGRAFFSSILTTLSTDATYLVGMKNRTGTPIWEQNAAETSVIYEISCHDEGLSGWNPFSIEIDGSTFNTRIKTRYDFGAINVHGTLRHWDFRIVAFGFGDDAQNEKLYGDFARAIQQSLYIPPKLSKPCLYFELDDSFFEKSKLVIDSILVHHVVKHKSTDKDATSILRISEVRALDVDSICPFLGSTFQIYKAESPPGNQNEPENLNIWYEASVSSAKAEELLKQNTTLELGDEAEWTPEKLEELDAASAMYIPACEMVKQMDGVGLHNDNGIDLQEASTEQACPPKPYVFW